MGTKIIAIILNILIVLGTLLIAYFIIRKTYKKCETIFERVIFVFLLISLISIMSIYYFDKFNLLRFLLIGKEIDTKSWLTIISSFMISILAETLGGIILIFVTYKQIEANREDLNKKEQENNRISNMPLLVYSFPKENINAIGNIYYIKTNKKFDKEINWTLSIKNIGMNAVRKCYLNIIDKSMDNSIICKMDNQSSIDKNQTKDICFFQKINYGNHDFKINVYYEDLLHNWYIQKIDVYFYVEKTSDYLGYFNKVNYIVHDEKITKKPKITVNIEKEA